ncbi:hypothetical protein YC2023_040180 [Brassica napus]
MAESTRKPKHVSRKYSSHRFNADRESSPEIRSTGRPKLQQVEGITAQLSTRRKENPRRLR